MTPNVRAEGAQARAARRVPNSEAVGRSPRARGWAATDCLAGTSRPDSHEHRPVTLPRPKTSPPKRRCGVGERFPVKRRASECVPARASPNLRMKATTPRARSEARREGEHARRSEESASSGEMPGAPAALSCRTPPPSPWGRHPDKTTRRPCRPTIGFSRRSQRTKAAGDCRLQPVVRLHYLDSLRLAMKSIRSFTAESAA